MSGADRPSREVAYRLFAAEFEDADYSYAESDEERAPNYVVTPTGARVNRLFVVGVLTEVEDVSDDVVRARIVDPTGAFVVYAGQYQPEALAFFERAEVPAFVAVTGKARTFQPDGSDRIFTSLRPESVNAVTAETRDRWTVQTAEHTIDRIGTFAAALDRPERSDALERALLERGVRPSLAAGIPRAIDHYGTTTGYLAAMRTLAIDAARVVADEIEAVEVPEIAPDEGGDVDVDFAAALPEPAFAGEPAGAAAEPLEDTEPTEPIEESVSEADAEETRTGDAEPVAEDSVSLDDEGMDDELGTGDVEPTTESVPEPSAESADSAASGESETEAEPDVETDAEADVETDEMYDLSEEERTEVEEEFGVEFETGNEVDEPGEADIETPEPEPAPETEPKPESTPEPDAEPELDSEPEPEAADEADAETDAEPAEDVDLEDAVVAKMGDLDDGDGAPRDELVAAMQTEYGVDEAAVEAAIQDALMGGRCYESGENRITPI